ncbi:MAG: membrane dipeptidase [Acidobacteria bacterium]|nr:membrane dipeptidase [Acidobacteriota bacterium]
MGAVSPQESLPARAERLHREALVVDTHADTLQRVLFGGVDLGQRLSTGHLDLPRMKEGGLDAQFFAVWVDSVFSGPVAIKQTLRLIDCVNQLVARYPDRVVLARTAEEVEAAALSGRIAALMGIEGGHAIDDDLRVLRVFHGLGVRYMTLTWSNTNHWADSSGDKRVHGGLTEFGRQVVREMNRIGMIVDISHVSDETFYEVLRVTKQPVIASHSSCRALTQVPRNMTDDMLRALAKNGGVIGINFYSAFLDSEFARKSREGDGGRRMRELARKYRGDPDRLAAERYKLFENPSSVPPPPLKVLIDHIHHAVQVAGVDHVGLGSDFDGIDSAPRGMEDVTRLPQITSELLQRGYAEKEVRKILGENFLRVLREVTGR